MSNVNELRVFIASPGDLAEERAELRDIERRVNSLFGVAGQRVRVIGWEETPPGYGRPQGQINPMVDDCDVFVGLLRRKWGSPTGVSDSGFFEEFERALDRRKQSGVVPEIAMYFADLSQGELDDAGPELKRVLDFRRRLETEHIVLYSTFASPDDLVAQVTELLSKYLVKLVVDQKASTGPVGTVTSNETTIADASPDQLKDIDGDNSVPDLAQKQLIGALDTLRAMLTGSSSTTPLDVDRLEFIGVAFGRDETPLGTHLVNRLYRRLDDLELIGVEYTAWVRTLLTDIGQHPTSADRVVPGWSLLIDHEDGRENELLQFATEEGLVGRGAVKSLHRLGARPVALWPSSNDAKSDVTDDLGQLSDVANRWVALLNANPGQSEVTNYLLQDAVADDPEAAKPLVQLVTRILESADLNDDSRAFLEATIQAFAGNPNELAGKLGYSSDAPSPWRLVLSQTEKLDSKILNRLANQNYNRAAKLAATKRGPAAEDLTDATLKSLLLEGDEEVQRLLLAASATHTEVAMRFLALIRDRPTGKSMPTGLEGRLMAESTSLDDLGQLDTQSEYSNAPWEALTYLTPAELVPAARQVLKDDASELRARLREQIGKDHSVISYLADDRKRVAASLLSRYTDRTDADVQLVLTWFKQNADDDYIPKHAWRILEAIAATSESGIPTDFFDAYQETLGFSSSGDLLDGPLGASLAPVLRRSDSAWVREPAEIWYISRDERTNDELKEALYDDLAGVRIAAAQSLSKRLDHDELKSVLDEYPTRQGQYWYNVSATLDENLYAPTPNNK